MKPQRDRHTEMLVRNMNRGLRERLAEQIKTCKRHQCVWLGSDGKPIPNGATVIGINEGPDAAERPYVVLRDIIAKHASLKDMFIRAGETTDLGSIPWLLKILPVFRPTAPGKRAFLRHDNGYKYQLHYRKLLDTVMEGELVADGMPKWAAKVCYIAVRLFGGKAWARHAARIAASKGRELRDERGEPD